MSGTFSTSVSSSLSSLPFDKRPRPQTASARRDMPALKPSSSSAGDQASSLRSLAGSVRTRRATVIAITSGKGGVGKSNIAVNLAIGLAAAGKQTVLLDADLGLANADVLCGVDLPANLSHLIGSNGRRRELRDVIVDAPGGFKLIGGASGLARMADLAEADRRRLVEALGQLEDQADVILVDTGAGISPNVLSFTRAADQVLVVTTPEPTAITDAYAVVKVVSRELQAPSDLAGRPGASRPLSLIVNQAESPAEAKIVYQRISRVARQFLNVTLYDAGHVMADGHVTSAVRRRVPFTLTHPKCPAALCIQQLVMRLEPGVSARADADGGFFARMSKWMRMA